MSRRLGFTLIELLVVISIIALLVAILLPTLANTRAAAELSIDQSNARQTAVAFLTYATDFADHYPRTLRFNTSDDYGWTNRAVWDLLDKDYGLAEKEVARCRAYGPEWNPWPNPVDPSSDNVESGWVVWVGRSNDQRTENDPGAPEYQSPQVVGEVLPNSSRTMFTCRHFQSIEPWGTSFPHVPNDLMGTERSGATTPDMVQELTRGLVVALVDGSNGFTPIAELTPSVRVNNNREWKYYQAD